MLRHNFIAFAFLFVITPSLSQTITHYGFKQGLNSDNVVYVDQDQHGRLLIGFANGSVTSFDGLEFKEIINSKSTEGLKKILGIISGKYGFLIAASDGITFFNFESNSILYKGNVKDLINAGDSILFIDDQNKLNAILSGHRRTFYLPVSIKSIIDLNGTKLVLSLSNKVFRLAKNLSLQFVHDFSKASTLTFHDQSIHIMDNVLVAVPLGLVPKISNVFNPNDIQQVVQGLSGETWVLSKGELFRVDQSAVVKYTKSLNFTNALVHYLFKDFEDNIWVGTVNGLYKIHQNKFQYIGEIQSGDRINTISSGMKDQVWVGTERGRLFTLNDGILSEDISLRNFTRESINAIHFDPREKKLWLATDYNWLLKVNADGSYTRLINRNAINSNIALQIFNDTNQVWITSRNKIFRLPGELVNSFIELTTSIGNQSILTVYKQNEKSIILLTSDHIYRISGNEIVQSPMDVKNLENKIFTCFEIDTSGRFWIGTWGYGVILIDNIKSTSKTISRRDGLNSDIISDLISMDGSVYVGSPHGIDEVFEADDDKIKIRHLNGEIIPVNQHTFYNDQKTNTLWFGSGSKCYYYKLESEFKKPCDVSIEKVTFFGSNFNDTTLTSNKVENTFKLRYNENNVEFQFLGISLTYPEAVTYSTRLVGSDSSWSYPVKDRAKLYHGLQPGHYKFEVMAYNPDGIPNTETASVEFIIRNPLWKEPGLIIGVVIIIISAAGLLLRMKDQRTARLIVAKEKRQQEITEQIRIDIARDFHDNIGNKLAGLKLTSNLIRIKLKDENKDISKLLDDIEKDSQSLFDGTKDFIWSIDPESDNLTEVFTYIRDFGERCFERTHFTFFSSLNTDANSVFKIPPGWSRQLVMIFKEAMTNSLKHSNGDSIQFSFQMINNQFVFTYSDNGRYDGSKNFTGRGMKNMTERSNSIGGQLAFEIVNEKFEIKLTLILKK